MCDGHRVHVETLSAAIEENQPSEGALYRKAFNGLKAVAAYGAEAEVLVVTALETCRRSKT
ncbi:hypothetical protein [Streptomyces avicenniae]|uniref:hypothetical protein n=1 Tax=Streptomyces avicenniae TaxID=500153 RepID=UPI00167D3E04|nr:hypothetical protein [Streptomyces avicenniae]